MAGPVNDTQLTHSVEGYHRFPDGGSFEVFWSGDCAKLTERVNLPRGWYWWACFPGCLPDGEPHGPFNSAELAYQVAIGDL